MTHISESAGAPREELDADYVDGVSYDYLEILLSRTRQPVLGKRWVIDPNVRVVNTEVWIARNICIMRRKFDDAL